MELHSSKSTTGKTHTIVLIVVVHIQAVDGVLLLKTGVIHSTKQQQGVGHLARIVVMLQIALMAESTTMVGSDVLKTIIDIVLLLNEVITRIKGRNINLTRLSTQSISTLIRKSIRENLQIVLDQDLILLRMHAGGMMKNTPNVVLQEGRNHVIKENEQEILESEGGPKINT